LQLRFAQLAGVHAMVKRMTIVIARCAFLPQSLDEFVIRQQ
jgi:hypothetical protein